VLLIQAKFGLALSIFCRDLNIDKVLVSSLSLFLGRLLLRTSALLFHTYQVLGNFIADRRDDSRQGLLGKVVRHVNQTLLWFVLMRDSGLSRLFEHLVPLMRLLTAGSLARLNGPPYILLLAIQTC
jgi:hypothetical protein